MSLEAEKVNWANPSGQLHGHCALSIFRGVLRREKPLNGRWFEDAYSNSLNFLNHRDGGINLSIKL